MSKILPVLVFILIFSVNCKAQKTIQTVTGYQIIWPELYVIVDTVIGRVYAQSYLRGKHFINVKTGENTTYWSVYEIMWYGSKVSFKYNKNYIIRFGKRKSFIDYHLQIPK